jgi:formylglycine-generating enzyme required for sulfatase activity/diacylglycerol kinase family enzyme
MTGRNDSHAATVAVVLGERRFDFATSDLPVAIGGEASADVQLEGVPGAVQIGRLGSVFFAQAARGTRNVRIDGRPLNGTAELREGSVIALDRARLTCALRDDELTVAVTLQVTAGDTAPPDIDELARNATAATPLDVAITPVAFDPNASAALGRKPRGVRAATVGVAAAFAVLAAVGWFAFTARSVALNIEPVPAELELPDTLFKLRMVDRFLLQSGSHRVVAELDGYYPLDTEIAVGRAADQSFDLKMTKLPGLVSVTTNPAVAAEILIDGAPLGTAPLTLVELEPGPHRFDVHAERFLPESVDLEVQGGGMRQSLVVPLRPNWAPVTLETTPPGAEVLVDAESVGRTPIEMELTAGERALEVRLRGYNAWTGRAFVTAGEPQTLEPVRLVQADGRVELTSTPSEANVSVDGEFRGRTPLTLRLRPGRDHEVMLSKPGYATATRALSVDADSGRRLAVELEAQYGEVDVASEPAVAEVWVDGEREGTTPSRLTLTAVPHEIEVRREGYSTHRVEITPRPGYPQTLSARLEELDDATGAGYPRTIMTSLDQPLVRVPAGDFIMGSSRSDRNRRANEMLPRPVRIAKAFYIGAREVSNAEFREWQEAAEHDSGEFAGLSLDDDEQPVVNVRWEEIAQYLNWLSIRDRLQPVYEQVAGEWRPHRPLRNGYRLPTEAEWEWAARFAGREQGLYFPWGPEEAVAPPDRSGNYADISAAKILPSTLVTYNDGFPVAAPTQSFDPDSLGVFNLGGNVSEWVQDYYVLEARPPLERATDPLGPEQGTHHVVRGASWRSVTKADLRVVARNFVSEAREDVGFRIARNLE